MVDAIACRHVAWHGLWTQMRDSGGHRWMRVKKKERKKSKLTGCRWLTRLHACVCGLWKRMRGTKREKKNDWVWILDMISCRRRCIACGRRWWWARTYDAKSAHLILCTFSSSPPHFSTSHRTFRLSSALFDFLSTFLSPCFSFSHCTFHSRYIFIILQ